MIRVGVVIYPGFQLLTLAVVSVFEYANMSLAEPLYVHTLLSEHGGPVRSSCGVEVGTVPFGNARYDTVLVVGDTVVTEGSPPCWPSCASRRAVRGAWARPAPALNLAQAGLLDGKRATTHWAHVVKMRRHHPEVLLEEDSIFVQDGSVWTSAEAPPPASTSGWPWSRRTAVPMSPSWWRSAWSCTTGAPAASRSIPRCSSCARAPIASRRRSPMRRAI